MNTYMETKDTLTITTASVEVGSGSFVQLRIRTKLRSTTKLINSGTEYFVKSGDVSPRLDGPVTLIKDTKESEVFVERSTFTLSTQIDGDESQVVAKFNPLTGRIAISAGDVPDVMLANGIVSDLAGALLGDCNEATLATAATAIAAGTCVVSFAGDSVTEGGDVIDPLKYYGSYRQVICDLLSAAYPSTTFSFYNFGLGSRTGGQFINASYTGQAGPTENSATGFYRPAAMFPYWGIPGTGSVSGKSWKDHVKDSAPHLLFVVFGLNAETDDMIYAHLNSIKTEVATWTTVPSVVLIAPYRPAKAYQDQFRAQGIARIYREFARKNSWSYLDVNRIQNIMRDGFDEQRSYTLGANQNSGLWTGWNLVTGGTVTTSGNSATFGANSYLQLPISSHDVSVSCKASMVNSATQGILLLKVRDGSTENPGGSNRNPAFLRCNQTTMQIWDGYTMLGAAVNYTPSAGGDEFKFEVIGSVYKAYLNGTLVATRQSYSNMRGGAVQIGALNGGAGLVVTDPKVLYKSPATFSQQITDAQIFGADYSADTSTKYPYGGNGANHASSIGTSLLWTAPARELLRALRSKIG